MKKIISLTVLLAASLVFNSCSTTRKKAEVKGLKKFYHNTTAKFNGYFNAEELLDINMLVLQDMHQDNFNDIIDVYDYVNVDNPKAITPDMDKAIEKVTTVATIHDVSNYLDDCYVVIGKAQYMKQDYAAAEETFQYFEEEFDPLNPYGRVYKVNNKRKTGAAAAKEKKKVKKERLDERKEKEKTRDEERKEKLKERKDLQKEREKASKARKKKSKKSRSRSRSDRTSSKTESKEKEVKETAEQKAAAAANKKALEEAEKLEKEKKKKEEEEKQKEKQKEEESKYKNEGEGAIFRNKSAYTEGLYWLARTYIERGRYSTADYIIKKLENTPGLTPKVANKLPAAKANMFLKSKEYPSALVALQEAIEKEKNKKKKGRYAFIKAQLYERMGDYTKAHSEYQLSKKYSPEYELELNAQLNELKLAVKTGRSDQKQTLKKLERILTDSKNSKYQDQIYFAIAEVKLNGNDKDGAIADFENALASAGSNGNVKLESYYRLAGLLFDEGFYRESKTNYDSALKMMKKNDDRYREVERLANNLSDVSKNIEIVELQDSLLELSMMSDAELREIALQILEDRNEAQKADLDSNPKSNIISSSRTIGASNSKFFAYNPRALNQGKIEFDRVWGDRVIEDNWRRSLRPDAGTNSDSDEIEEEEEVVFTEDDILAVLRDIPKGENQKKASHIKIQNALLELGTLFRKRIRNYEKSADVLERLVREYPDFEKRDEALFYLYLTYLDMEKEADAQNILNRLSREFPDSKFTKLALDPSYAEDLKANEESIASYYDNTYYLFQKGNFNEVVSRVEERGAKFPGNKEYAAKFSLINAMSYGNLEGKDRYVKELQNLIRVYPKTPEEARAKEILRFLKGDEDAFNEILFEEAIDVFKEDDKKLHYVFIVTYDMSQKEFDRAKLDISAYNKEYHRFDNLKISNIYLNPKTKAQIILVRSFIDKDKSLDYYSNVQKNKEVFIKNKEKGYDVFTATQRNYREVMKQRTVNNYRSFFESKYLKKKNKAD